MKKKNLAMGIMTVMFFNVAAKFMSFLIELMVAYKFGATKETDIYYLVYGIIQVLTPMITIGIWKVFMPAYKEFQVKNDNNQAKKLTDEMISIFLCVGFIFVTLLEVFPKTFISIFAPGFSGETMNYAALLLRIMSPMLIFIIIAVFHSAILQANKEFAKSQIKYVFQHLPVLMYLLIFQSFLTIKYLSLSLVLGEVVAFIIVAYFNRKEYHFSLPQNGISPTTKKVLRLVPVACLNSIINQINHIVDKAFGSVLKTGSLTYLTYGHKVISLFDGIVTTAFSTAFFPHLAELNAKEDEKGLKSFLGQYVMTLLCVLMPVMTIIILYSETIVKIVFGHGQFDNYSVKQTSIVLLVYGIGLLAMGMNTLFNDVFYIKKKTTTLFITNVINIIVNLGLDFILIRKFEILGLCLATTLSIYITITLKAFLIRNYFDFGYAFIKRFVLILIGCLCGAVVPVLLKYMNSVGIYVEFIVGSICFALVYGVFIFRPGTEFNYLISNYLFKRKGKK